MDQRSIVARSGLATEQGLRDAQDVYAQGLGGNGERTIQALTAGITANHDVVQGFRAFYGGVSDYAQQWLQAAFTGTSITLGTREVNFSTAGAEGRTRAVSRGTVVLSFWMAVVDSLEQALAIQTTASCDNGSVMNAKDSMNALTFWDKAFALYTGSQAELEEPQLGGYLLYRLAQVQCEEFGTCKIGDEAPVNKEMLSRFWQGKTLLSQQSCSGTPALKNHVLRMKELLIVPILQASLRNMYAMDLEDDVRPVIQGETAAFGAAAAAIIYMCSPGSADIVDANMAYGKGMEGSFEVVKSAFERQYDCLGITCKDMGGIITHRGDTYSKRAEACAGVQPVPGAGFGQDLPPADDSGEASMSQQSDDDGPQAGVIAISVLVAVGVVFGVVLIMFKSRKGKNADKRVSNNDDQKSEEAVAAKESAIDVEATIEAGEFT